jgi:hypothetical protein
MDMRELKALEIAARSRMRHPPSGRRRPGGDPGREYVSP